MALELICLAWAMVVGLVHIIVAGKARTNQLGTQWNMSARDGETPPVNPLVGRLLRAQSNFFETFPLFAVSILIVAVTQAYSSYSYWGAIIYLIARIIYFPLYAIGIPVFRTLIWLISIVGLLLVLVPLLF